MKFVFNKRGLDLTWGESINLWHEISAGWLIFALGDMGDHPVHLTFLNLITFCGVT
jgi:hypothetical protein